MSTPQTRVVSDIGACMVAAFREARAAVAFLRCDDEQARQEALAALTRHRSTVIWRVVDLAGSPGSPQRTLADASQGETPTIVVVRDVDAEVIQRLAAERDAYDQALTRAIFFITPKDMRTFAQKCPAFWERRDLFTAWPIDEEQRAAEARARVIEAERRPRERQTASRVTTPEQATALFQKARGAFYTSSEGAEKALMASIEPLKAHHMLAEIAETYELLGVLTERRNDWRAAEAWYEQALVQWKAVDDARGMGSVLGRIGSIRFRLDDAEGARRYLTQSLQQEERAGDGRRISDALRRLAMVREREGALKDAATLFDRALKTVEPLNDDARLSHCLQHLGRMKERLGLTDDALALYERSYRLKLALGDHAGMATSLHQMGNVYFQKAQYEQAVRCYRQAIGREHKAGDERGMASTLVQLGLMLEQRFDYEEGLRCLLRAVPLLRKLRSGVLAEVETHIAKCRGMVPDHVIQYIEEDVARGARDATAAEQALIANDAQLRFV